MRLKYSLWLRLLCILAFYLSMFCPLCLFAVYSKCEHSQAYCGLQNSRKSQLRGLTGFLALECIESVQGGHRTPNPEPNPHPFIDSGQKVQDVWSLLDRVTKGLVTVGRAFPFPEPQFPCLNNIMGNNYPYLLTS